MDVAARRGGDSDDHPNTIQVPPKTNSLRPSDATQKSTTDANASRNDASLLATSTAASFSLRPNNNTRPDRAYQRPQFQGATSAVRGVEPSTGTSTNLLNDGGGRGDPVSTPPASEGSHDSSQDTQLLQLSQVAAAQEKMPDGDVEMGGVGASSRKRMADGLVKHSAEASNISPTAYGHSRNTSTVSMTSTGSRIGELSTELKTRLSYAMIKVNNGWQSHSIDQVEALASHAASPTSTASTVHLRNGASASPQLSATSSQPGNHRTPPPAVQHHGGVGDGSRNSTSPLKNSASLAPPVLIQPSRSAANSNPRRNSTPRHTPSYLGRSAQASPVAGPQTPSYLATPQQRTPGLDPIVFSPHQNVREQDAIESLLFMSSPGNSANLKHSFPSSSQPIQSTANNGRTALPTGQPRKSLPSGRPAHHTHSQSQPGKRVGFERSPPSNQDAMDVDDNATRNGSSKRKSVNGGNRYGGATTPQVGRDSASQPSRKLMVPLSSTIGLSALSRSRPVLAEEDIDRMLDQAAAAAAAAAADSSDSDGEIQLPMARTHREGARMVGA